MKQVTQFDVTNLILKNRDIVKNDKLVFLILSAGLNHEHDEWVVWPSLTTIQADTGLTRMTVLSAIRNLSDAGWLIVRSGSRTKSNRYVVNVSKLQGNNAVVDKPTYVEPVKLPPVQKPKQVSQSQWDDDPDCPF